MTDREQKAAAKAFAQRWATGGREKQDTRDFWAELLEGVYGVENLRDVMNFEKEVLVKNITTEKDTIKYIDGYIAQTLVLIEQKDSTKSLTKKYSQSDKAMLDAYGQADRYGKNLNHDENPRWIVTCNFLEFRIYDMNRRGSEPEVIKLSELPQELHRLAFLTDKKAEQTKQEQSVSLGAGEIVGRLYDALLKQYHDPENQDSLKDLNKLCVRIVFCLYAEDAGVFRRQGMFHDYLQNHRNEDRRALIHLFKVLDQCETDRDPYLDEDLSAFPYVNGGLFEDENIEIPRLGDEVLDLILDVACSFNWSKISPTIFGAVFESTLNPATRREGGMHYTSIENIHKVIDPLFLDGLRAEYHMADSFKTVQARVKHMLELQEKLASLKFLDPACGSGNFLTETYLSLRRMENDIIRETRRILKGQQRMSGSTDLEKYIKISISQFYGIEINDFAVAVARTALWIAEIQMKQETEELLERELNFLPLKSNPNIIEENALTYSWEDLVNKNELNYIMSNPPFRGHKNVSDKQKDEMKLIFNGKQGRLDYVSAWYKLAAEYIDGTNIETAFVSTNTVVQGIHISSLWDKLIKDYGIYINFAYQTFRWTSESKKQASVFCVIIGFSQVERAEKRLFLSNDNLTSEVGKTVTYISPYLDETASATISARTSPICNVPEMIYGNIPRDGGNYTFSKEEKDAFLHLEPSAAKYFYQFGGSVEFISNEWRWILFLKNCSPNELIKMPKVLQRVEQVKKFRLSSKSAEIHKFANYPTLFAQLTQPMGEDFIIVPIVSSAQRPYIPIGFIKGNIILNNRAFAIPNADLYCFGIMTSNVHNAWMRKVGVRLKNDYSYSKNIVYNNFPWPEPTEKQKAKVVQTAQAILDARALHPECTMETMYKKDIIFPAELQKAHQRNDRAVWEAYGKAWPFGDEEACTLWLMKRYQELTTT